MPSEDPTSDPLSVATTTFLLERLKDPADQAVWHTFIERYRPMILRTARRSGLGQEDAQDAAQMALMAFFTAYREGKYDRQKGRLRHWLFGIARHWILNTFDKRLKRQVNVGNQSDQTDFFARQPADDQLEQLWEQEWREATLRHCLEQVRTEFDPKTFQAFLLFAQQGLSAQKVAEQLGVTSNAVFISKHRVLKRIRELLPEME
jgi:RNA polymerase sigma factor (sigma-70 family)